MSQEPDVAWKAGLNTKKTGALANSHFTCSKGRGQGQTISMNATDKRKKRKTASDVIKNQEMLNASTKKTVVHFIVILQFYLLLINQNQKSTTKLGTM